MESPIRSEGGVRVAIWTALALFAVLNALWFSAIAPPPSPSGLLACEEPAARSSGVCSALRPSWQTWDHTATTYAAARACTISTDSDAVRRMSHVDADRGMSYMRNLEFLQMVRAQQGDCAMPVGEARLVEREFEELTALEHAVWSGRIERAIASEASWISTRSMWHEGGQRWLPLWMPTLLFLWMTLLVATRRMLRYAEPFELDVTPAGIRLDGQVIPRAAIAYLSLEGRRLRVERWSGPPIYSRPLPPEALANVDEICGSVGLWDDEPEQPERPAQRRALEQLLRTT